MSRLRAVVRREFLERVRSKIFLIGTFVGPLLMLGLFSRAAALGAATMLFSFYLAMPPWPGVPPAPGPEHSLIIDKNLVEALACLALAATPSGRWVGLDSLVRRYLFRRTTE